MKQILLSCVIIFLCVNSLRAETGYLWPKNMNDKIYIDYDNLKICNTPPKCPKGRASCIIYSKFCPPIYYIIHPKTKERIYLPNKD